MMIFIMHIKTSRVVVNWPSHNACNKPTMHKFRDFQSQSKFGLFHNGLRFYSMTPVSTCFLMHSLSCFGRMIWASVYLYVCLHLLFISKNKIASESKVLVDLFVYTHTPLPSYHMRCNHAYTWRLCFVSEPRTPSYVVPRRRWECQCMGVFAFSCTYVFMHTQKSTRLIHACWNLCAHADTMVFAWSMAHINCLYQLLVSQRVNCLYHSGSLSVHEQLDAYIQVNR